MFFVGEIKINQSGDLNGYIIFPGNKRERMKKREKLKKKRNIPWLRAGNISAPNRKLQVDRVRNKKSRKKVMDFQDKKIRI